MKLFGTRFLYFLLASLTYWILAMLLFYALRFVGIADAEGIEVAQVYEEREWDFIAVVILMGFLLGLFYALSEFLLERSFFKRRALGIVLLVRIMIYLLILLSINVILQGIKTYYFPNMLFRASDPILLRSSFWVYVAFFGMSSFLFSFVRMVSQKAGKGVLLNMLLGKYRMPKEEKRVFIFVDLKDSTRLAEKLGHVRYSQLIQRFFYDLNEITAQYDGEIYQYVGDEAVVSWPYEKAIRQNRCLNFFFAFQEFIRSRAASYKRRFGVCPEFKAGMHGGLVTVTEVGIVKKDIAYHGDVLNTTSRIQGACNTYDERLLVSETLLHDLDTRSLHVRYLGGILLRGKREPVNVGVPYEKAERRVCEASQV